MRRSGRYKAYYYIRRFICSADRSFVRACKRLMSQPSEVRKRERMGREGRAVRRAALCKIPGACNTTTLGCAVRFCRVIGMLPQIKGTELIRINDLKSGAEI